MADEPEEIQFLCIGCGTANPAGAEVCAGCGHRFAGPEFTPVVRPIDETPVALELPQPTIRRPIPGHIINPYEPPAVPMGPPSTFRIGTGLVIIAEIAVCLAALRADVNLGILVIASILPAAIRTPIAAGRRRAEGRPMVIMEQVGTFCMTLIVTWGIAISSIIAFCVTCFPSGVATQNFGLAVFIGGVSGIACAVWLLRVFLRISRENRIRENEIRYR